MLFPIPLEMLPNEWRMLNQAVCLFGCVELCKLNIKCAVRKNGCAVGTLEKNKAPCYARAFLEALKHLGIARMLNDTDQIKVKHTHFVGLEQGVHTVIKTRLTWHI